MGQPAASNSPNPHSHSHNSKQFRSNCLSYVWTVVCVYVVPWESDGWAVAKTIHPSSRIKLELAHNKRVLSILPWKFYFRSFHVIIIIIIKHSNPYRVAEAMARTVSLSVSYVGKSFCVCGAGMIAHTTYCVYSGRFDCFCCVVCLIQLILQRNWMVSSELAWENERMKLRWWRGEHRSCKRPKDIKERMMWQDNERRQREEQRKRDPVNGTAIVYQIEYAT